MMRVYALEFLEAGSLTSKIAESIFYNDRAPATIPGFQRDQLKEAIATLIALCEKICLPVSLTLLNDRKDNIPQSRREWDMLVDAVRAELKTNLFLFVPIHRAKYYEITLQQTVPTAFPDASRELVAAGNSLAVGLYTACVFHSMRAAEIGVRVLGAALDVKFPGKPLELAEWANILDQAESKIAAMKNLPKGTFKDEELNFYSQAAVQFRYFKDGWRVRVAHARETYEESPALKIFGHTVEFFETLATRLRE